MRRSLLGVLTAGVLTVFCGVASADDILDVTKTITYPSTTIKDAIIADTGNALFDGMSNTFYQHTGDMPMTRFVLGTLQLDLSGFKDLINQAKQGKAGYTVQGETTTTTPDPAIVKFDPGRVETALDKTGAAFDLVMKRIPIVLLAGFFSVQLFVYMFLFVVGNKVNVSPAIMIIRLMFFFIALLFFKVAVGKIITYSNYAANLIIPYQIQEQFIDMVVLKVVSIPGDHGTLGDLVNCIFRFLGVFSIKILIILRDVYMSLSLLLGPFCFALGYISMFGQGQDIFTSYVSGWIRNFIKLLFWGPLAAIMIYAMGVISIVTGITAIDGYTAAIFGLACLFAAKDIPNLAENFSGIAMASLIGKIAPALGGMASAGTSGAGLATMGAARGSKAIVSKLRSARAAKHNIANALGAAAVASSLGGKDDTDYKRTSGNQISVPPSGAGTGNTTDVLKDDSILYALNSNGRLTRSENGQEKDAIPISMWKSLYKIDKKETNIDKIGEEISGKAQNLCRQLQIYRDKEGGYTYGWSNSAEVASAEERFSFNKLDKDLQAKLEKMTPLEILAILDTGLNEKTLGISKQMLATKNSEDKMQFFRDGISKAMNSYNSTNRNLERWINESMQEGEKRAQ